MTDADVAPTDDTALAAYASCPYCALPMAMDEFQPWTVRANLMSAACGSCGRVVTMATARLQRHADHDGRRFSRTRSEALAERDDEDSRTEDLELAVARLAWVREAHCPDIPEQATAILWHVAACDEALRALGPDAGAAAAECAQ